MIHGVGAETGSQVLLIAAVGGASSAGLGVPMLFAFVIGLLISNFAIVLFSSVGFVSSQARERVYVAIGAVAGVFSLFDRRRLPVRARRGPAGPRERSCRSRAGSPPQSPPRTSNRARRSDPSTSDPTITTAMITTDSGSASGVWPNGGSLSPAAIPSVAWRIDRKRVPSRRPASVALPDQRVARAR